MLDCIPGGLAFLQLDQQVNILYSFLPLMGTPLLLAVNEAV